MKSRQLILAVAIGWLFTAYACGNEQYNGGKKDKSDTSISLNGRGDPAESVRAKLNSARVDSIRMADTAASKK